MKHQNNKLTEADVKNRTQINKVASEKACSVIEEYTKDKQKQAREGLCKCRYCYYLRGARLAGQAFTEWNCGVCDKESMHCNTSTPVVCMDCAKKHSLCSSCGGDLYDREKRKPSI